MKKFGAYLSLLGLLSQASALAWVGGPYSNNTYDGFDGGIFGGTIRGSACSGIFKFSQGNEAYVSPFGDSIVYHKGMAYYGECYGFVDFDSKTVSGVTNGSNSGANQNDPNSSPQFRNLYGSGFGVQNGTGAGIGSTNNFGGAQTDTAVANSYWNGKITKSKQTMRFRAKGEMTFFGNATQVTEFNQVQATGDFDNPRADLDTGLFLTGTNGGNGTLYRVSGAQNNYPNITATIKIRIYGSRTSVGAFAGPTGYSG
jgi:hypothetical protein